MHEKDENKIKTSLKDKAICAKCIFIHRPYETECQNWAKPYICETHEVHKMVCKCKEKDKIFKNLSINQTAIGSVGFDSEIVSIRNGKKVKRVLLTYDSFASHTSMDVSLKDELQLSTQEIGDLKIQTYGGIIREKEYQTTAVIEGLKTRKIDFMLSKCPQTIPEYEYNAPFGWKKKYNLIQNPKSRCGINKITRTMLTYLY